MCNICTAAISKNSKVHFILNKLLITLFFVCFHWIQTVSVKCMWKLSKNPKSTKRTGKRSKSEFALTSWEALGPRWHVHRWPCGSACPQSRKPQCQWFQLHCGWASHWQQEQMCPLCTGPRYPSASGTRCRGARYSCAIPAERCC